MSKKDVEKLQDIYNDITKESYIGGSSQLEKFSKKCLALGKDHEDLKIPTYVISSIFKEIANNQYDRKVTQDECEDIYNTLNPSLQDLFEDMKTGGDYQKNLNQKRKENEQ